MDVPLRESGVYVFGPFRLDPLRRTLLRRGIPVTLTARLFDTLLYFVLNTERLLERDELEQAIWRGRCVGGSNLQKAVSTLRKVLRENDPDGTYIVTVPGRGLRLAVPVAFEETHGLAEAPMDMFRAAAPRLAKLSAPRLPSTIARPRLFTRLALLLERRIVWVTGPPGAGKTTLVCSYIECARIPCIWYTVDAGDADPASFFFYMREAALAFSPGVEPLPLLTAEYRADLPGFTRRFFRSLVERLPQRAALVLDNFQEAPESSPLPEILRDGAAELGNGVCLAVLSRNDPPAVLARLRANQDLALIGWDELRLTATESADIVTERNPRLSAYNIHQRSGGWAAGLTLLLEGHAAAEGDRPAIGLGAPQALFDYFVTELYEQAPPGTRRVWLSTAYLPRFTGADAATLSGVGHADQVLNALVERRTFTDRHIGNGTHYQYHALFREFLRGQMDRQYSRAQRRRLAQRSARIAEADDDFETALSLHKATENWPAASDLVLAQADNLFAAGRFQTLLAWLDRLPPACARQHPWLLYWQGRCQEQCDPAASRTVMTKAYQGFVENGDSAGQALSMCAVIETYLVERFDFTGLPSWIEKLQTLTARQVTWSSETVELRVWSVLLQVQSDNRPHEGLDAICISRVWQLCRLESISPGERLMAAAALLFILGWSASQAVAQAAREEFEALASLAETSPLQRATWRYSKDICRAGAGDYAGWATAWREAGEIAAMGGLAAVSATCFPFEIWQLLNEGRLSDAASRLQIIETRIDRAHSREASHYDALCAWLALLQNQPAIALSHAERMAPASQHYSAAASRVIVGLDLLAQALAQCGRAGEALVIARKASALCRQTGDGHIRLSALLHEADMLRHLGRHQACLDVLAEGLATGRRGCHFSTVPWLPKMMTALAEMALQNGIETEYVTQLVQRRRLPVGVPAPSQQIAARSFAMPEHSYKNPSGDRLS